VFRKYQAFSDIVPTNIRVRQQVQGLSNYLSGQASIAEIIYRTNYENMDIIFSGSFAPNPSELLGQEAFGTLLGAVREHYRYAADRKYYRCGDRRKTVRRGGARI
jgi:Mrp family chromosome partitioning ATPase